MMHSTITLVSGGYFDFTTLDPQNVHLPALVHACSQSVRFCGQTLVPYSILEHSVRVSDAVGLDFDLRWQALLHDIHEGLIGDVSTPVKRLVPAFKEFERIIEGVVRPAIGCPLTLDPMVKLADSTLVLLEHDQLQYPCEVFGEWEGVRAFLRAADPDTTRQLREDATEGLRTHGPMGAQPPGYWRDAFWKRYRLLRDRSREPYIVRT